MSLEAATPLGMQTRTSIPAGILIATAILIAQAFLSAPAAAQAPRGEPGAGHYVLAQGAPAWQPTADPVQLELDELIARRNAIDIAGITAAQWISASAMIVGGVAVVLGLLVTGLAALADNDISAAFAVWGGSGGGLAALGGIGLALCELDGNLHRRREISGRIRELRRMERDQPSFYFLASATSVGVAGRF